MIIFENAVFCVQKVTEYGCSSQSFLMVAIPGVSRMCRKVVLMLFLFIKFLFNFQHQVLGVFGWGVFCSKLLFLQLRGKYVRFVLTPASPSRDKLWFVLTPASPSEDKLWFVLTPASPSEDKLWFVRTPASPSEDNCGLFELLPHQVRTIVVWSNSCLTKWGQLWFVLTPASPSEDKLWFELLPH